MLKLFKQYWIYLVFVFVFSLTTNGLALWFPKKMGQYIDDYQISHTIGNNVILVLGLITLGLVVAAILQAIISSIAAERIGKDLRKDLISKLKDRSFSYIRETTSAKLITVFTSDVDAVRQLVSSGLISMLTATITLIGAIIFLLVINWRLGLATISVIPFIVLAFGMVFGKLGSLFGETQVNLDRINKVINESIIASPLVRVLNSEVVELNKFHDVNETGTNIGRRIVTYFASLIPIVSMLADLAILIVLYYGGYKVINGTLSIGELAAFFSYTAFLMWPIFVLGFSSQFISKAQVSLERINSILNPSNAIPTSDATVMEASSVISNKKDKNPDSQIHSVNKHDKTVIGHIEFKNVTLEYNGKQILKNISFEITPNTKTAIVGPTGAGKTELFYLMSGLAEPTSGEIIIDGIPIKNWNSETLLSKIGMVFQDSIIFQTTIGENILFNANAQNNFKEDILAKAIDTADLNGLVERSEKGLETYVGERGLTLSGGQKQRIMLARALALNPSVLLLDDFTARVDVGTEERIVKNLEKNFPELTLISITQK